MDSSRLSVPSATTGLMNRFLDDGGEGNEFYVGSAYETPTWGSMRVAGIIMVLVTITSYIALFLLAKRRRQREMVKAAISKTLDEEASFIEFVPPDAHVATLEEIKKGQFNDMQAIDESNEDSNLQIFCGDPNQGLFSQLSKIQQTWLDTSKPGLAGLPDTLVHNSSVRRNEQIGVGSPASTMGGILEQDPQDAFLPQQSSTHRVNSHSSSSKPIRSDGRSSGNNSPATCWTNFCDSEKDRPFDEAPNDAGGIFHAFETDSVDVEVAEQSQEVMYSPDMLRDEAPLFLRRQTRIVE